MGKRKRYWAYRWPMTNGYFALKRDFGANEISFWHKAKSWECYYVFLPNEIFHVDDDWTADRCRDLETELRKQNGSPIILHFAATGKAFANLPVAHEVPTPPEKSSVPRKLHQQREQQLGAGTAERVLFGKFDGSDKEYAWWLPWSVCGYNEIQPGAKVVVWAQGRRQTIATTHVEPYDGSVEPSSRVIRMKDKPAPAPKSHRETVRKGKSRKPGYRGKKKKFYRRAPYKNNRSSVSR